VFQLVPGANLKEKPNYGNNMEELSSTELDYASVML
jgi:hypothetical protein